jgi:hypothetical protein
MIIRLGRLKMARPERIDRERRVHQTVVQGVLAQKRIQKALKERQQSTTSAASTNEIRGARPRWRRLALALSSSWGLIAFESEQKQKLKS